MDLAPVKLGGALFIQCVNSALDFHSELRGHEVFDGVAELLDCAVRHIIDSWVVSPDRQTRIPINRKVKEVFEGVSHREFVGVAPIAECPVINIEESDRIIAFLNRGPFADWVKIGAKIEIGDSGSDTVFGPLLARYMKTYTVHDEIGVIDETGEGPG